MGEVVAALVVPAASAFHPSARTAVSATAPHLSVGSAAASPSPSPLTSNVNTTPAPASTAAASPPTPSVQPASARSSPQQQQGQAEAEGAGAAAGAGGVAVTDEGAVIGGDDLKEALRKHCTERLAAYQAPKRCALLYWLYVVLQKHIDTKCFVAQPVFVCVDD